MNGTPMVSIGALVALLANPVPVAAQTPAAQVAPRAPLEQIQGFHVVLVVGETQPVGETGAQGLPASAQRALTDMRDFLPYKHYRVLDAQWTSCCSGPQSRISGRLQGMIGVPAPNGAINLVHRPYGFAITARSSAAGIQTQFVLVALDGKSAHGSDQRADLERLLKNTREDLATLEVRLKEARGRVEVGVAPMAEAREMEDKVTQKRREIEGLQAEMERAGTAGETGLMDSSFTMNVGETVVVGTSKLGGDKALIAVLTAVRKAGSTR